MDRAKSTTAKAPHKAPGGPKKPVFRPGVKALIAIRQHKDKSSSAATELQLREAPFVRLIREMRSQSNVPA